MSKYKKQRKINLENKKKLNKKQRKTNLEDKKSNEENFEQKQQNKLFFSFLKTTF